jgi:hypothetical protein
MNPPELIQLAQKVRLGSDDQFRLRIAFGVACIEHVEHLLIDSSVIDSLAVGKAFVAGECDEAALVEAAVNASAAARSHPGTSSLDGAGSAAVSTSLGAAAALAGRALEAAGYAAYASVYSYASHAVTDISAYNDEHTWQINKFRELSKGNERQAKSRT